MAILDGPADFAGAHACSLGLSRVGEKEDPRRVHARGGSAVASTINLGPLVTPYYAVGNSRLRVIQLKALATKQLYFARDAARVPANPAVRGNHAMARDVDRHWIVVHRIADGPRAACGPHGGAQGPVADYRTARHRPQFVQDLPLEGMRHESEIDLLAERLCVSGEVETNLLADFFNRPLILDEIELQPQFPDLRRQIAGVVHIMIEHNATGAHCHQQLAQRRFH